jgi:hypothetical protein
MPPTWAATRSTGSSDWRRSLASKLKPAGGQAAVLEDDVEGERELGWLLGNWSVSQPDW